MFEFFMRYNLLVAQKPSLRKLGFSFLKILYLRMQHLLNFPHKTSRLGTVNHADIGPRKVLG